MDTRLILRVTLSAVALTCGSTLMAASSPLSDAPKVLSPRLLDEDEAGLLAGPVNYERMNRTISICRGCWDALASGMLAEPPEITSMVVGLTGGRCR